MDTKYSSTIIVDQESSLANICHQISNQITKQLIIGLSGEMGTGKTTFVRYLCDALGSKDWVNSPTYSLIQTYNATSFEIIHVDLYRCNSFQDVDQLDLLSLYHPSSILMIEWIERFQEIDPDILLKFEIKNNIYSINLSSQSETWIADLDNTNT